MLRDFEFGGSGIGDALIQGGQQELDVVMPAQLAEAILASVSALATQRNVIIPSRQRLALRV